MTKTQLDKFKQAARDLECDESENGFERKLKRVATPSPSTDKTERNSNGD